MLQDKRQERRLANQSSLVCDTLFPSIYNITTLMVTGAPSRLRPAALRLCIQGLGASLQEYSGHFDIRACQAV